MKGNIIEPQKFKKSKFVGVIFLLLTYSMTHAATPLWTFSSPLPSQVQVSDGGIATVKYVVTNQSRRPKNLKLKSPSSVSASSCYLPEKGSTCSLILTIYGNQISSKGLHEGPILCQEGNENQCYQPGAHNILHVTKNINQSTSLQLNISELALSVVGITEYDIPQIGQSISSGRPRKIEILNTGGTSAINVRYETASLPDDSHITPANCGTIEPSGICVLTIEPGTIPSAAPGNTQPTPIRLKVAGDNTNQVNAEISILTYGSVYQHGYVFAFDDTKGCTSADRCLGSVGGKSLALEDQAPRHPGGVYWSADNTGGISYDSIWGIALNSTFLIPFPNASSPYPATQIAGQSNCDGSYDGTCNSNNVTVYYSPPNTIPPVNLTYYAAGRCKAYQVGGLNDWYLPAICEMGPASNGSACRINTPNIVNNLEGLISGSTNPNEGCTFGTNCLYGIYWSSTEHTGQTLNFSWDQEFNLGGSSQLWDGKGNTIGVRCVRAF